MDQKTHARLNKIRSNYDALASAYAQEVSSELDHRPLERELLQRFAQQCPGVLCDLGCGPGHIAEFVSRFNRDVIGLDLSPRILNEAHGQNPEIVFLQGNMLELPFAEQKLAGIIAFYSIIHFNDEQVILALAEMHRVLQPGGRLLIGVHVGSEMVHTDELWGIPVDFDAIFFDLENLRGKLVLAGFIVIEIPKRNPHPDVEYQSVRGYIWAERAPK